MKPTPRPPKRDPRDLGLAVFGGCTTLGGACLLLAACAGTAPKPESVFPVEAPRTVSTDVIAPAPASKPAERRVEAPWPSLRASFALQGCDYNPAVRHWTKMYTQVPREFSSSLADAMPYLLLVGKQLDRHHLPGEFAFLPYLESNYTPIATTGDRAAGIWQLMPDTAREAGLRINGDYDGRLDIQASTIAAISLLQQYHAEFGDWRLADMAFNAGLYKVRGLVAGRDLSAANAREIGRLNVNPGTHDHLAKLLALSCIVSDPDRFHVRLPDPHADDELALLDLPAPVDLQLAARLAGVEAAQLRRLNPGLMRGRMPADGPLYLLVPAPRRVALERTLGKLPQYMWRDWHEVVLKRPETLDLFAMLADIDPTALADVNGFGAADTLDPGTHLLLPGAARATDASIAEVIPQAPADNAPAQTPDSLVVHAGDTLWDIAHRYGVRIDDLVRWNGLKRTSTLRLGQRLLLAEPQPVLERAARVDVAGGAAAPGAD